MNFEKYSKKKKEYAILNSDKLKEYKREWHQKNKEKNKINKRIDTRSFVFMDDCLSTKKAWANDQTILELLQNGRHYKIMYVLTMQDPLGVEPNLRSQFDYVFFLATDFVNEQKRIYDNYVNMFPSFSIFKKIYEQLTAEFGCMVLVNTNRGKSNNDDEEKFGFLKKIFWYRAAPPSKHSITIGCEQLNNYHRRNYNKNWKTKTQPFNMGEYCLLKKKNKEDIKVKLLESESKNECIA